MSMRSRESSRRRTLWTAASPAASGLAAFAVGLFAVPGAAQVTPIASDAPQAEVIAVDEAAREITVRFEENEAEATFAVAEDAEFYVWDGVIERPREFGDIVPGQYLIGLEFEGLEGDEALMRAVTDESEG